LKKLLIGCHCRVECKGGLIISVPRSHNWVETHLRDLCFMGHLRDCGLRVQVYIFSFEVYSDILWRTFGSNMCKLLIQVINYGMKFKLG